MNLDPEAMQALFANVSGLSGLLVFLNQLWHLAPIEQTLITSFGTGLAVYLVLLVSYAGVQRILAYAPPEGASGSAAPASSSDTGKEAEEPAAASQRES